MEHLALEIFDLSGSGSQFAVLPDNTRIHVRWTSRVFDKGYVWTHDFTLNLTENAHIFGTAGDIHGSRLHELVNKRRARLWVEGVPSYYGYLRLDNEVDVDADGNVDVRLESGRKTFDGKIEGGKANQVPMLGDVQIGVALWRKRRVKYGLKMTAYPIFKSSSLDNRIARTQAGAVTDGGENYVSVWGEGEDVPIQQYPRMVYPRGQLTEHLAGGGTKLTPFNFLNTDYPYAEDAKGTPSHPYCNVALCYQRYGYERKDANGTTFFDYASEPEAQRGYEEMPADRVNSAPCFFVLYWLRALMTHLGIYIEENQLLAVEDMRRLFFVNTNCAYEEPEYVRNANPDERFGKYQFGEDRLVAEQIAPKELIKTEESGFVCTRMSGSPTYNTSLLEPSDIPEIDRIVVKVNDVPNWGENTIHEYKVNNSYLHNAFATSECFPDVEISKVINALESGFGVRFLFDDDYQRVRIVLLRNIFRNGDVQELGGDVIAKPAKTENGIRGFRMTYGKGTEDTHFYYKGFADLLPHMEEPWPDNSDKHDYSQWVLNADYANILQKVSAFDKTCYVTPHTGNAYGIKIDKDAKRYDELHPSLFEFGGYMDAEDGDCTGEPDTIEEVEMGFTPAIMNDINMDAERNDGSKKQHFALFVDEQMRPRRLDYKKDPLTYNFNDPTVVYDVDELYATDEGKANGMVKPGEFAITSDMYAARTGLTATFSTNILKVVYDEDDQKWTGIYVPVSWTMNIDIEGHVNEGYRLYLQDNYEPNDDGVSPIETHDWGLILGIMRGSGSDAAVRYEEDTIGDEGNDWWEVVGGTSVTAHPDTCDCYGQLWDYQADPVFVVRTPERAKSLMNSLFPRSNFNLTGRTADNYLVGIYEKYGVRAADGNRYTLLLAELMADGTRVLTNSQIRSYVAAFLEGKSVDAMYAEDAIHRNILIRVDGSAELSDTLKALQHLAFGNGPAVTVDGEEGIGSLYGRFSLKLRAEKPNPSFDPAAGESADNRKYLGITNPDLRGRGLADQFYKEYSKFVREAREASVQKYLGMAELSAIDDTVKVHVGDVTGFMKEMEFDVDIQTGLSPVSMKILYI